MTPVLQYLLSEARGWLVAVLVVVFEVLDLVEQGTFWRGDMVLTMDILGASIIIAGPLVAASVAVDTSRHHRSTLRHLDVTARRGARQVLALVGATVVPVVLAHVAVSVIALGMGRPTSQMLAATNPWLALLLQVVVLGWFGVVGLLVGEASSPVLAGIMGIVVAYGLTLVFGYAGYVGGSPILDVGNALTPQIGRGYDVLGVGLRAVVVGGLAAVTLGVRQLVAQRAAWRRHWVPAAVLAGLLLTTAIVELPERRSAVAAFPDICTDGQVTTVCVYPEHRRHVVRWTTVLDRLVGTAANEGYHAWSYSRLSQWFPPDTTRPAGQVFVADSFGQVSDEGASDPEWIASVITPVECLLELEGDGLPPATFDETHQRMVATWAHLVGSEDDLAATPMTPRQVADVMSAWDHCDLDFAP